ncbi:hypothetical protein [Streptomyces sp. NPDC051662]|uniref:hypothetical protein n=1 Tax=Streptomyces sp. NPDC051662 TaxID=3154750 RepID=UPI003441913F
MTVKSPRCGVVSGGVGLADLRTGRKVVGEGKLDLDDSVNDSLIVSKVTGRSIGTEIERRIVKPLGPRGTPCSAGAGSSAYTTRPGTLAAESPARTRPP